MPQAFRELTATPPEKPCGCQGPCRHDRTPMLRSMFEAPHIRERLHTICSLYFYSPRPDVRRALLNKMEDLTLEVAHLLAIDLLENGWRPDDWSETPPEST